MRPFSVRGIRDSSKIRECLRCSEIMVLSEFYRARKYSSVCNSCHREYQKNYRKKWGEENREYYREYNRGYMSLRRRGLSKKDIHDGMSRGRKIKELDGITYKEFGFYVKNMRERTGMSIREMADFLDVHHNILTGIEEGKTVPRYPVKFIETLKSVVREAIEYLRIEEIENRVYR